jgi:hypothetical protein
MRSPPVPFLSWRSAAIKLPGIRVVVRAQRPGSRPKGRPPVPPQPAGGRRSDPTRDPQRRHRLAQRRSPSPPHRPTGAPSRGSHRPPPAPPRSPLPGLPMSFPNQQACLEACNACVVACETCAAACRAMPGKAVLVADNHRGDRAIPARGRHPLGPHRARPHRPDGLAGHCGRINYKYVPAAVRFRALPRAPRATLILNTARECAQLLRDDKTPPARRAPRDSAADAPMPPRSRGPAPGCGRRG